MRGMKEKGTAQKEHCFEPEKLIIKNNPLYIVDSNQMSRRAKKAHSTVFC